ncbi:hypothetical protein [Actinomadura sp. 9N215]|uniref:hypothetical protein n=1 Tax=Actinomadura sp. 9N215 TaxID=3375150 RepID=UPI00378AE190
MRSATTAATLAAALTATFTSALTLTAAPPASADTAPPPGEPPTVTADPLPTWQTNGTVWTVTTVGGTVYAGGSFSAIRPPGAAPGDPRELPRGNVAAFDAATGEPLAWNPSVESNPGKEVVVNDLEASPDGRSLYVAGIFTKINGLSRPRIGAFSLPDGALTGFRHDPDAAVEDLAVSGTTLYAGGSFAAVDGVPRERLAAFDTATGALTAWAPTADRRVMSVVLSPDGSQVVIGGKFNRLNGSPPHGLGAVRTDATGTSAPWETGLEYVSDSRQSWATALVKDDDTVYVSAAGTGTFDGRLAVDPNGGHLRWIDGCKGGTEAVTLLDGVLYSGSHAHDCSTQPGGFPQLANDGHQRLLAEPARPDPARYDTPPILHWFPDTDSGPDGGQGPRSMDNDGRHVWVGGDFTTVNKQPQQGITRFGSLAVTDDVGPPEKIGAPTVTKPDGTTGTLTVTWTQTWDRDNATLTYQVVRDDDTVVHSVDSSSRFWELKTLTYTDTGLTPGSTHTYTVRAIDHFGNTIQSRASDPVQARSAE